MRPWGRNRPSAAAREPGSSADDVQQLTRVLWEVAAHAPSAQDDAGDESRTGTAARVRSRLGRKPKAA